MHVQADDDLIALDEDGDGSLSGIGKGDDEKGEVDDKGGSGDEDETDGSDGEEEANSTTDDSTSTTSGDDGGPDTDWHDLPIQDWSMLQGRLIIANVGTDARPRHVIVGFRREPGH